MSSEIPQGGDYPITIKQGKRYTVEFELEGPEGELIDLTGYTGAAQIKNKFGGTLLATFTVTITPGDANNPAKVALTLPAADTAAMPSGGVYDVELSPISGDPIGLVGGAVYLKREVTTP